MGATTIGSDKRAGRGRLSRAVALGLGVAVFGGLVSLMAAVLELEENAGLDRLFILRGSIPPPEDVVIIAIDGDSADVLGLPSTLSEWPRSLHAQLVTALSGAGAAVIAFDIMFDRPRAPEHDAALQRAMEEAGNVILLERVGSETISVAGESDTGQALVERRSLPIEPLRRAALATAPFPLPVVPIKVSQLWIFGRGPGGTATLPAVALQAYALPVYEAFIELLREARPEGAAHLPRSTDVLLARGGIEIVVRDIRALFNADRRLAKELLARLSSGQPDDSAPDGALLRALVSMYSGGDSRYLHYYGPPFSVRTIPYHQALHHAPELDLEGKMVFVGFSERRQPEQQDEFYSVFSQRSGMSLSGVEIAATGFGNLLERSSVRPLSMPAHLAVVAAWGALLGGTLALLPVVPALLAAVGAGTLYALGAVHLFQTTALWVPLMVPLLAQLPVGLFAALLWHHRRVQIQRERIQTALGYYVPARVVNRLAQESVDQGAGRQLLYGTCMVTDADRYTALSEGLEPDALGRLMNDYYGVLVEAVDRHGGEVSDIGGDSMVAIWAAARPVPGVVEGACRAALDIRAQLEIFNSGRGEHSLPTRIGLDSGEVLLANVGARRRFEYRAVGDIVNTASRLQGLNRQLGTRVLISARTLLMGADGLRSRRLGSFVLVGKREALEVHELTAADGEPTAAQRRLEDGFAAALDRFEQGSWGEARVLFLRLLEEYPDDGPSRFYADLCNAFMQAGTPGDWTGAIRINVK